MISRKNCLISRAQFQQATTEMTTLSHDIFDWVNSPGSTVMTFKTSSTMQSLVSLLMPKLLIWTSHLYPLTVV